MAEGKAHRHAFGGRAVGAKDAGLAADHVDRAWAGLDHRHSMLQSEFQKRLAGMEAVEDPGIGLVGVALFVLILIGRDVEPA